MSESAKFIAISGQGPTGILATAFRSARTLSRVVLAFFLIASQAPAFADKPACFTFSGGAYCQYTGTVSQLYINSSNDIIFYFDTPFATPAEINLPGGAVQLNSCLIQATNKMDFAKIFYASALAAQASGKRVTIQMYSVLAGYPVCDKIWVIS